MITNATVNATLTPLTIGPTNIVGAFFVGLLMLSTLFGNFLVWASFITFRELRTKCNYFIISLAVADIMVALLAMPFWFILQLEPDLERHSLSRTSIEFWNSIDILCGTSSIMNLAAVSADRHLAITAPYSYHKFLTTVRAILVLCFVWAYAITMALLRLAAEHIPNYGYQYIVSTFSVFLPLMAMIIMYARIYSVAKRQARLINLNQSYKTDIKAAKTIAVVIGVFVICWMPFFVTIIGFAVDRQFITDMKVFRAIKWMEYLNSCLNPIIYCCLNRTYRGAFKRLFNRWRKSVMRKFSFVYHNTNDDDNLNTSFLSRNLKSPSGLRRSTDESICNSKATENGTSKKELLAANKADTISKQTQV